ncbi:MAG TPA: phosphoribosylglycinamide formyltransferase [Longimicrobiales bacterium]
MTLRLAVFASGGGSNLQALIDRFNRSKDTPVRVAVVLSDRAQAGALERARAANIEASVIVHAERPADLIAREMLAFLHSADIDIIALAGYLRLVPAPIVRSFRNRIINIHPALLPSFGGKGMYGVNVHRAVLESGCAISGATVHYVDEEYDRGRIIAQWPVPVRADDSPDSLAARVLRVEHMLYPAAVELVGYAVASGAAQPAAAGVRADAFTTFNQQAPDVAELRRALGLE